MHDELDLPFERLKLGAGGGPGGHNGVQVDDLARSATQASRGCASASAARPPAATRPTRCCRTSRAPRRRCCPSWSDAAADAVEAIVSDGLTAAMNRFNGKQRKKGKQDKVAGQRVIDTAPSQQYTPCPWRHGPDVQRETT